MTMCNYDNQAIFPILAKRKIFLIQSHCITFLTYNEILNETICLEEQYKYLQYHHFSTFGIFRLPINFFSPSKKPMIIIVLPLYELYIDFTSPTTD